MVEVYETPPESGGRYEPLGTAKLVDHDDRSVRFEAGATTVEVTALARSGIPDESVREASRRYGGR